MANWGWYRTSASLASDTQAQSVMNNVMGWLRDRVCPVWRRPVPTWAWYGTEGAVPADAWKIGFHGDNAASDGCGGGCGGFHSADGGTPPLRPIARIFTSFSGNPVGIDSWTLTASHEAAEMIVDPFQCGSGYFAHDTGSGDPNCYIVEVGDPVEFYSYTDPVYGPGMTDFVLPAYFIRGAPGPYDWLNNVSAPFQNPGRIGPNTC